MMSHLILSKLILYNHCCGEEVEDNKRVEDEREREEQTKLRTSMGKYKSKLKGEEQSGKRRYVLMYPSCLQK